MRLLRDSIRAWMRTPGTALLASGGLALALAAVTTRISIVDHLVLRTMAIDDPHELHVLAAVTLVATWWPARRVSTLDPAMVLRRLE